MNFMRIPPSDDGAQTPVAISPAPIEGNRIHLCNVNPVELSISRLFLAAGDLKLSEFEQELTTLWNECLQRRVRGFRGTNALSTLVNRLCIDLDVDFVFYDCGPNIGPLNKVVLLDCDWFIVPAACDLFSIRALRTLGQSLSSWIKDWMTISRLAPEDLPLLKGMPKFLGYIPQRFKSVSRGSCTGLYGIFS